MIKGYIKQIETMGIFDGPGIRTVIFMQGCPLRCLYCHNPEMWVMKDSKSYTPEEIVNIVLKYKNYFKEDGGVTFSGGEPLSQQEFLLECLKLLKENNINTCLDTSGVSINVNLNEEILKYIDLVIFDIKAIDKAKYKYITNYNIDKSLDFINLCNKLNKKLWIRSVIVPGINDNDEYINQLANFIKHLSNIEKIELLPYHTMGKSKYEKLNIDYKLKDVKQMDNDKCKNLENKLKELLQ
ncbi:MAG: pyruvate formate lyase-activating protein [Tenericutes bacterium]|nr:pyruvate formate lyase-activating protein [Mycoplasmatota bacterium]